MATSGSYGANGVQYGNYAWIAWQLAGQEVGNNRSLINWQAYAHYNGSDSQLDNGVVNSNVGQLWANGGRVKNYTGDIRTKDIAMASGSFWVNHGNDGRGFVQFGVGVTFYQMGRSEGTSGVWELTQIPRQASLTNLSQDINDLANPWVEFSNPAGYQVNGWFEMIDITGGTRYFQHNWIGSRHTWELTEAERNQLRALIPDRNTTTIRYVIETNVGGNYMADWRDRVYTIVDANPTFADFAYRDKNATTVAITGNDQWLIQGQSELELIVSTANKAVPKKQATMTKYNAVISSTNQDVAFSANAIAQSLGVVGANADAPLVVKAIDSRGNNTSVSKTVKILPYVVPQVTLVATRVNNFETSTKIHLEGVISRLTVDNVDKNAVNAVSGLQYRYKKTTDVGWSAWTNRASAVLNGNLTSADFNVDLDRNFAWQVQAKITDKIQTTTVEVLVTVGIPIFRIGLDGKVYNNEQPLMASHIGQIIHSTTLTTASAVQAIYGGTWVAWSTGRMVVGVDTAQTEFNTVEKTGGAKQHSHGSGSYQTQSEIFTTGGRFYMDWVQASGAGGYNANRRDSVSGSASTEGNGEYQDLGIKVAGISSDANQGMNPYTTAYMWKRTA